MIAQRCMQRGLGSLYAHANEMTWAKLRSIHAKYTPRGLDVKRLKRITRILSKHLYLRQPGVWEQSYINAVSIY